MPFGTSFERQAAVAALIGATIGSMACAPSPPPPSTQGDGAPLASASTVPIPTLEPSQAPTSQPEPVPESQPEPVATAEAEPVATVEPKPEVPECPPIEPSAGFTDCRAVELTGAAPCEAICERPRRIAKPSHCCERPVDVVVLSGARVLLHVAACSFVSPKCAHTHGHGNMDSDLRVLDGSPPEVVVVEGGCEMRAMAHGYVPAGVAAWTGCRHERYQWDGNRLAKQ